MATPASVSIAGGLLALLQFETLNDPLHGDVEGLLRVERHTQISDSSEGAVTQTTDVVVTSFAVVPPEARIYDGVGKIDAGKLTKAMAGRPRETLIGVFKFRRNMRLVLTLRDAAVYDSLQHVRAGWGVPASDLDLQLLCLLSASMDDPATMTQDIGFLRRSAPPLPRAGEPSAAGTPRSNDDFTRLAVRILNLFDPTAAPQTASLPVPFVSGASHSGRASSVLAALDQSAKQHEKEALQLFAKSISDFQIAANSFVDRRNEGEVQRVRARATALEDLAKIVPRAPETPQLSPSQSSPQARSQIRSPAASPLLELAEPESAKRSRQPSAAAEALLIDLS
ncbi:hypothetical protein HK105_205947 [Polyrhizophydium stewartii]|uniref:Uncharacterized protein n=1 Tax=Polyrhizophydium stewartii TaxID=2732419 RepID=A0ABR4N531_9FUNG